MMKSKIQAMIFDVDGVVIQRDMYFSKRLSADYNIPEDSVSVFFNNEFQDCLVGEKDLKESLKPYLTKWGWGKTAEDLLQYWFASEQTINEPLIEEIKLLRTKSVKCYIATNNERYRTNFLRTELKFDNLFDKVFSSADLGYKKSNPKFWKLITSTTGSPDNAIVWDNDSECLQAASTIGFQTKQFSDTTMFREFIKTL